MIESTISSERFSTLQGVPNCLGKYFDEINTLPHLKEPHRILLNRETQYFYTSSGVGRLILFGHIIEQACISPNIYIPLILDSYALGYKDPTFTKMIHHPKVDAEIRSGLIDSANHRIANIQTLRSRQLLHLEESIPHSDLTFEVANLNHLTLNLISDMQNGNGPSVNNYDEGL